MTIGLTIFQHPQFGEIRWRIDEAGNPRFIAADACRILDLGNPRSSLALLDDDEKGVHTVDTLGGPQEMAEVTEPGLYSLILRSRKPEAKEFKRFITHELLPSIRKHGGYLTQAKIEELLSDPDTLIRLATNLKAEREARQAAEAREAALIVVTNTLVEDNRAKDAVIEVQTAKIAEDAPKVDFVDRLERSDGEIDIGDLGKELSSLGYPTGPRLIFGTLHRAKVLFTSFKYKHKPYQDYINNGFMRYLPVTFPKGDSEDGVGMKATITGKGIRTIMDMAIATIEMEEAEKAAKRAAQKAERAAKKAAEKEAKKAAGPSPPLPAPAAPSPPRYRLPAPRPTLFPTKH